MGGGLWCGGSNNSPRADARTIYPWFSMTKMVTATAVMQLVEHGQLHLDDSATDYLPEHTALFRPERYPAVTIRHLLGHSSGLANPIPPPARAR